MKNSPAPDTKVLDTDLIKRVALLGAPLPGFDSSKKQEKQVIDSIFGKLTYNPKNQGRGGVLEINSNDGKIIIKLDYRTFKVVSVETNNDTGNEDKHSVLSDSQYSTLSLKDIELWALIGMVSSLAREVLELKHQLNQLKGTPTK